MAKVFESDEERLRQWAYMNSIGLPEELCELESMIIPIVINYIPETIFLLSRLVVLDCKGSNIESLPDRIGHLSKLELLNCSRNKLESLPDSIGNLSNLEHLDCSRNKLESLPDSIGNLSK